ncbi:hypothetical protein [Paenibacillus hexagrammi]|uniref:Uncharacterized protein n=1 Tax=Paenibacillus hexagrammi TaxID=2908839 RepID=A0ABY3SUH6_9BACL|nr:hypothetical protein [Paenibacillus sp. YPD9-1]UJF36631.1 hypothetical protein L0M14_30545 [Paenibacillus sp. YPD9-1]
MFKYEYVGKVPVLLIGHNIEVKEGDVVTVKAPISNAAFVLVEDKKKSAKEATE